ncbi:bifunctional protein: acetyl-glutamate kinase; acetyl-ornithine deacetylase [Rhizocola hellebori]|uniref:Bifunctional protein: acetyl-glutamate kinase acetyl-ornithine deacetylase n=2 Tax=Rhizocola hellebori TaxID=1392758 RepID=A0A8J3QI51_9ACTN|nr:bifunctional protein: acetyl-glutamate kinase; acetyl-ornithine deacetylase [Rhizocola hellebori]
MNNAGLASVSPYSPLYVVKVGSASLRYPAVYDELAVLRHSGARILLVTGGAADIADHYASIDRPMRTLQLTSGDEVRYCPPEEMPHIVAAYERLTLTRVSDELGQRGLTVYAATASTESLVTGTPNRPLRVVEDGRQRLVRDHRAGVVSQVAVSRLDKLLSVFDVVCVSPPVAADDEGAPLNVDADVLAAEIARALDADHLRLVTGTPGLLADPQDRRSTLPHVRLGDGMAYARGRMRQKVRAAELALAGTGDVAITGPHTVNTYGGTRFWRAPAPEPDLDLLARMVEISSVSGNERELALFLLEWLTGRGVSASVDAAGNLVATRGCGPRTLLLLGHMDTVPYRWPVAWEGDVLTGRGCVDAKASLAVFLETLVEMDIPDGVTVRVVGTVEEERTAAGALCARDLYRADAVIVGEPSGSGALTIGYHGVCKARIRVVQSAGHTAGLGRRTAASQLVDTITEVQTQIGKCSPEALFAVIDLDAGGSGATQTASAVLDVRVPPEVDVDELLLAFGDAELLLATPAVSTPRTDPLVRAFTRALRAVTGGAPRLLAKKGSSDMNTLATTWRGVPMVAYGPGDAKLDHTPDERISAGEYRQAKAVLAAAVRDWCVH